MITGQPLPTVRLEASQVDAWLGSKERGLPISIETTTVLLAKHGFFFRAKCKLFPGTRIG